MIAYLLLLVLAVVGLMVAGHLVYKRKTQQRPKCLFKQECHVVLESKYNCLFGIHNDVIGVCFYGVIALASLLLLNDINPVRWWYLGLQWLIALAGLFSLVLIYIQWHVLKNWCSWCIFSALVVLLMEIVLVLDATATTTLSWDWLNLG